jgi:glutamate 5-kinase
MQTKVEAAIMAADSGIPALVTSTANVGAALAGEDVGTWFTVNSGRKSVRMMWLAHLAHVQGRLFLDDGAVHAVRDNRYSLLPAGISSVDGTFEAGDAVEMVAGDGTVIARGLVNYSSEELPQMLGRSTQELGESLGRGFDREVVHIDDLVLV